MRTRQVQMCISIGILDIVIAKHIVDFGLTICFFRVIHIFACQYITRNFIIIRT